MRVTVHKGFVCLQTIGMCASDILPVMSSQKGGVGVGRVSQVSGRTILATVPSILSAVQMIVNIFMVLSPFTYEFHVVSEERRDFTRASHRSMSDQTCLSMSNETEEWRRLLALTCYGGIGLYFAGNALTCLKCST